MCSVEGLRLKIERVEDWSLSTGFDTTCKKRRSTQPALRARVGKLRVAGGRLRGVIFCGGGGGA